MSSSIRDIFRRVLARIGAMVGFRRTADAAGCCPRRKNFVTVARSIAGSRTWVLLQTRSESSANWLQSASRPCAACSMSSTTECLCRAVYIDSASDRQKSSVDSTSKTVSRRGPGVLPNSQLCQRQLESRPTYVRRRTARMLADHSATQGGWIKLPEFESTTPRTPPSEPQFAVDPAEIDLWIEQLGSGSEWAIEKVVSFGDPATPLRTCLWRRIGADGRIPQRCMRRSV